LHHTLLQASEDRLTMANELSWSTHWRAARDFTLITMGAFKFAVIIVGSFGMVMMANVRTPSTDLSRVSLSRA